MAADPEVPPPPVDWDGVDDHPVVAATFGIVQGTTPDEVVLTFGYIPPRIRLAVEGMDRAQAVEFIKSNPVRPTNVTRISMPLRSALQLARVLLDAESSQDDRDNSEHGDG